MNDIGHPPPPPHILSIHDNNIINYIKFIHTCRVSAVAFIRNASNPPAPKEK